MISVKYEVIYFQSNSYLHYIRVVPEGQRSNVLFIANDSLCRDLLNQTNMGWKASFYPSFRWEQTILQQRFSCLFWRTNKRKLSYLLLTGIFFSAFLCFENLILALSIKENSLTVNCFVLTFLSDTQKKPTAPVKNICSANAKLNITSALYLDHITSGSKESSILHLPTKIPLKIEHQTKQIRRWSKNANLLQPLDAPFRSTLNEASVIKYDIKTACNIHNIYLPWMVYICISCTPYNVQDKYMWRYTVPVPGDIMSYGSLRCI